jgi:hypothetical protein
VVNALLSKLKEEVGSLISNSLDLEERFIKEEGSMKLLNLILGLFRSTVKDLGLYYIGIGAGFK